MSMWALLTRPYLLAALLSLLAAIPWSAAQVGIPSPLVAWTGCASGNQLDGTCRDGLRQAANFLFGEVDGQGGGDSSQLSVACGGQCRSAWLSSYSSTASTWTTAAAGCGGSTDTASLIQLAQASTDFMCFADPAQQQGSSYGLCVEHMMAAVRAVGIMSQVRSMDSNLRFTGSLLQNSCRVMLAQSCCFQTWTQLMAAHAQQLCLPDLAQEYLSLPGRCAVASNPPGLAAPPCMANWTQSLLPLLKPRTDCGVWTQPGGGSTTWTGTACTPQQTSQNACPANSCDMWCSVAGSYSRGITGNVSDGSSNDGLSKGVIIFISVFSGVVGLLLLLALIMLCVMWRKGELSRRAHDKEAGMDELKPHNTASQQQSNGSNSGGSPARQPSQDTAGGARPARFMPAGGALGALLRNIGSGRGSSGSGRGSLASRPPSSGRASMAVSSVAGRGSLAGIGRYPNRDEETALSQGTNKASMSESRPSMADSIYPPDKMSVGDSTQPRGSMADSIQPNGRGSMADSMHGSLALPMPPRMVPAESPVHYANALYGEALPPTPSPANTPSPGHPSSAAAAALGVGTGAAVPHVAVAPLPAPDATSPPRVIVHRSSRSFSFGVDGASRLPPASAVAAARGLEMESGGGWVASVPHHAIQVPSPRVLAESKSTSSGSMHSAVAMPVGRWRLGGSQADSTESFMTAQSRTPHSSQMFRSGSRASINAVAESQEQV